MKEHKKVQADYRQRKRDKGMVQKEVWVFPDDWKEINKIISDKNKKRLDNITSDI
ncbi:hypothetical protein KAR91_13795 [Candidatus Pacearchaeota archaeon]|nr:hypothetical protein [Candidatus Pacearchaeota archaeon]